MKENVMEEFGVLMRDLNDLSQKVAKSQRIVFEHQKSLKEDTEKLRSINRQILEKLERMDVFTIGNAGWESRILNFLLAYRQYISDTGE